jgi:hypothetical protein
MFIYKINYITCSVLLVHSIKLRGTWKYHFAYYYQLCKKMEKVSSKLRTWFSTFLHHCIIVCLHYDNYRGRYYRPICKFFFFISSMNFLKYCLLLSTHFYCYTLTTLNYVQQCCYANFPNRRFTIVYLCRVKRVLVFLLSIFFYIKDISKGTFGIEIETRHSVAYGTCTPTWSFGWWAGNTILPAGAMQIGVSCRVNTTFYASRIKE